MAGRAQQHEQQHLADAVGALADAFQLLDQVEEGEHGEQRQHDQHDAGDDLFGQVAVQDLHLNHSLGIIGNRNSRR